MSSGIFSRQQLHERFIDAEIPKLMKMHLFWPKFSLLWLLSFILLVAKSSHLVQTFSHLLNIGQLNYKVLSHKLTKTL